MKLFKPAFAAITTATIFFVLCATAFAVPLICIDPGHGGKDPGARSPDFKIDPSTNEITFISDGTTNTASAAGYIDGEINSFTGLPNRINSTTGNFKLWESDANLDISLKLKDLMKNAGYGTLMTRESDVYLYLSERYNIANNARANIFVSVHNNGSLKPTANGTETYHYPGSLLGELLANCIQDELVKQIFTYDRGVKSKGFTVLNGTNMPAVLVEGAFVTNFEDAKLLLSLTFRRSMAQGIFNGIDKYFLTTLPRIAGSDRYETAVCVSKEGWDPASTVILARGDDFPDALAGAPLAYTYNAPILLTSSNSLNSKTSDEIKRLGASKVIILGGTGAISDTVESYLDKDMGLSVDRIAGNNRFETASKIAERVGSPSKTAIIASGLNFPDALSISSYAAKNQVPILLVPKDEVTADVEKMLSSLGITKTIVVGGTGAVSQGIQDWLRNNNYSPERISGANRFETSALIAQKYFSAPTCAYVATGADFPDALSAACLAANKNAPIVLVEKDSLPPDISSYIRVYASNLEKVFLLGGNVPITDDVVREICAALYF